MENLEELNKLVAQYNGARNRHLALKRVKYENGENMTFLHLSFKLTEDEFINIQSILVDSASMAEDELKEKLSKFSITKQM